MKTCQCKNCSKTYKIYDQDIAFYDNLKLPLPTHCPDCRTQRRMARRNERSLYTGKCAMCKKNMVSIFPENTKYTVYCFDCWKSDKWEPLDYGQDFDFNKPFFDQFYELQLKVPRVNALQVNNENSEFSNYTGDAHNSYLVFGSVYVEDCYYGNPYYSKNCVDSFLIRECELCYECVTSEHLYNCKYCQDCFDSNDLMFCYDCKGCSDCIGCVGLRNKSYCVFNKELNREEYEKEKERINLCNPDSFARVQKHFNTLKLKHTRKFMMGVKNENVTGNYINESKSSYNCFDVKRVENSKYCAQVIDLKDCYDCNYFETGEQCVDYLGSYKVNRNYYSFCNFMTDNVYYCENLCDNLVDSFGCITVRKNENCILNKKYSKQEYEKMYKKIVEHMQKTGEWGEFFPVNISPYAYNETVAMDYFPLKEEDVVQKGWGWKQAEKKDYQLQKYKVLRDIDKVDEEICKEILACKDCKKNFKIIPQELSFYQQEHLPVPKFCPECRHRQRMALRTPRALWQRRCMCTKPNHGHSGQCLNEFETAYSPDGKEMVYCEDCYNKEIY